ncbi:hypothetical protein FMLHJGGC_00234 [Staphylococcus phage BSwM-KMM1]|nr:hypothetical protein FMLHJGGC_00234 [Pseudomonas phage BSwM KMM1]
MRFEDFLTQELGEPKENTIGELRYCCPFCGEKVISSMLNKR